MTWLRVSDVLAALWGCIQANANTLMASEYVNHVRHFTVAYASMRTSLSALVGMSLALRLFNHEQKNERSLDLVIVHKWQISPKLLQFILVGNQPTDQPGRPSTVMARTTSKGILKVIFLTHTLVWMLVPNLMASVEIFQPGLKICRATKLAWLKKVNVKTVNHKKKCK